MSVKIYGGSDDLIEVEGDIDEEFNYYDGDALLAFSNGVVLRVKYDDSGTWRISPVCGASLVVVSQAPEDDEDNYSDRATMMSAEWVVYGSEIAMAKR